MPADMERYSCQMALPGFGAGGQQKLQRASVLVIGIGGLGCPAALYLAAAGIGTLGIADYDVVSISNLHRQILYQEREAGQKKVAAASAKLSQQNPHITVVAHDVKIDAHNVMNIIQPYDIVVDATDNFDARYLINDACVLSGKPVVYGAIYRYEGQVAVWNVLQAEGGRSPHYRDVFPEVDAAQIPDCTDGGVVPPIAGIIGCMQANEVIKYLTATGELLAGRLLVLDAATMQSRLIRIGDVSRTSVTALPESREAPGISVHQLKASLHRDQYQLIDVRSAEERQAFHLGGKHIPVAEVENLPEYTPGQKPIVFYCASGKRSAEAVKRLRKKFPSAPFFSLEGGINAWKKLSDK